jgi:hypothetical protein
MEGVALACVVTLCLAFVVWLVSKQDAARRCEQARLVYRAMLEQLKTDPTNPDLKQKTLHLGRVYSNLTRNNKGVTIFDEVALMNDINAATAGATSQVTTVPPEVPSMSVKARLAELSELKASGLIDEQEYAAKRQKIIDEM